MELNQIQQEFEGNDPTTVLQVLRDWLSNGPPDLYQNFRSIERKQKSQAPEAAQKAVMEIFAHIEQLPAQTIQFLNHIQAGQQYVDNEDWPEAVQAFESALALHHPDFRLRRDQVAHHLTRCEVALEMTQIIETGNGHYLAKNWVAATKAFRQVMGLHQEGLGVNAQELAEVISRCERGQRYLNQVEEAREMARQGKVEASIRAYGAALKEYHPDFRPVAEIVREEMRQLQQQEEVSQREWKPKAILWWTGAVATVALAGIIGTRATETDEPRSEKATDSTYQAPLPPSPRVSDAELSLPALPNEPETPADLPSPAPVSTTTGSPDDPPADFLSQGELASQARPPSAPAAPSIPPFMLQISGEPRAGEPFQLKINGYDASCSYLLSIDQGSFYPVQNRTELTLPAGTHPVQLEARDVSGNSSTYRAEIEVEAASPLIVDEATRSDSFDDIASVPQKVASVEHKEVEAAKDAPDAAPVKQVSSAPRAFAEEMPSFPEGDRAMAAYLSERVSYPEVARENEVEGTVYVQMVVQPDGKLSNVKVARGIGFGCDEVALRVVRAMPRWKPGKQDGQAVPVIFTIPIAFRIP